MFLIEQNNAKEIFARSKIREVKNSRKSFGFNFANGHFKK